MAQKNSKTKKIDSERTLTRADLGEAVYQEVGLSRTESASLVEWVLGEVSNEIIKGNDVKVSGFGTFAVRSKGERIGRNPKTGIEVPITARKVITFRASQLLKDNIDAHMKKSNSK